ncbi:hypothetical protein [Pseudobacteriovorax antillogorgiicola]|uniref:Uncharacterized protein n=1 Tax=Pseudobacteriovorax antillogorgiicola TaxID=1513793 RepID=A0A1Y6C208_9BACT|nr:hypothetical protein [Pseudobacteriovorax antillogorgiicola]TCS50664.1 hypothetical protein EDD56_11246 [Pseudobacteriovorax antillogorgiicola]SMF39921.1 hypothetical protein SAMN06296036_11245 [Pseudobacteriovorax antillogorgiicola]
MNYLSVLAIWIFSTVGWSKAPHEGLSCPHKAVDRQSRILFSKDCSTAWVAPPSHGKMRIESTQAMVELNSQCQVLERSRNLREALLQLGTSVLDFSKVSWLIENDSKTRETPALIVNVNLELGWDRLISDFKQANPGYSVHRLDLQNKPLENDKLASYSSVFRGGHRQHYFLSLGEVCGHYDSHSKQLDLDSLNVAGVTVPYNYSVHRTLRYRAELRIRDLFKYIDSVVQVKIFFITFHARHLWTFDSDHERFKFEVLETGPHIDRDYIQSVVEATKVRLGKRVIEHGRWYRSFSNPDADTTEDLAQLLGARSQVGRALDSLMSQEVCGGRCGQTLGLLSAIQSLLSIGIAANDLEYLQNLTFKEYGDENQVHDREHYVVFTQNSE